MEAFDEKQYLGRSFVHVNSGRAEIINAMGLNRWLRTCLSAEQEGVEA